MPEKRVYYDCQVCGKLHLLTAKWKKKVDKKEIRKFHKVDMKTAKAEILLEEVRRSFDEMHPGESFDLLRLRFKEEEK